MKRIDSAPAHSYVLGIALIYVGLVPATRFTAAQNQPLKFEVASVKPQNDQPTETTIPKLGCHGTDGFSDSAPSVFAHDIPLGHCMSSYMTMKMLIGFAYDKPWLQYMFLMSGGPQWLDTDRFMIDAKAEAPATGAQLRLMFRSLLAERFKLVVHIQPKEMDVLSLVMGDKGPKLKPSQTDKECVPASLLPGSPPQPCEVTSGTSGSGLHGQRVPVSSIAHAVAVYGGGTLVVDGTGLTGLYDISTTAWNQDDDPNSRFFNPHLSSLSEMLSEQLGLKLKREKKVIDIMVIDQAEKPDTN
jgi:uncharacterized protein (TIGR03435 family)